MTLVSQRIACKDCRPPPAWLTSLQVCTQCLPCHQQNATHSHSDFQGGAHTFKIVYLGKVKTADIKCSFRAELFTGNGAA